MTRRAVTLAATLITSLAIATLLAGDPDGEKQLLKGIELLEVKHDLPAAAKLFDEASRSPDRTVAARALLYLAETQKRQGKEQARATYARIVEEFSGQPIAADARKRLAMLEGAALPRTTGMRQVASGSDANPTAHITPDGRFLSRVDSSGDVVVRDMRTDVLRRLLVKSDTLDASPERAFLPMVSPDGMRVVYVWVSFSGEGDVRYQLRLTRNQVRSAWSELLNDSRHTSLEPLGWSPDSSAVFVTAWKRDDTSQILKVSLTDRVVTSLESLDWRLGTSRPRLSPDGKYIAYSAVPSELLPPNAPAQDRQRALILGPMHLYVRPTNASGSSAEIVRGTNINESPIWTPDGKKILFVSNRSGDGFGLWQVGVEGGKAVGGESYVQANLTGRIRPVGMTSYGTLYYVPFVPGGVRAVDVYHAELDAETGRIRGERQRLFDSEIDRSQAPSWSPDGERVAFKRLAANGGQPQQPSLEVVVYSLSGRKVESRHQRGGMDAGPAPWFDDGQHLLIRQNNGRLFRLNLKTGDFRNLESVAHSRLPPECGSHVLSAVDRMLYLSVLDPVPPGITPQSHPDFRRTRRIVAFDVNTGDQNVILPPRPIAMLSVLAVSPDGQSLALAMREDDWKTPRLVLMGTDGGRLRDVAPGVVPRSASWTRAGLLVAREGSDRTEIVRVSPHDGTFAPIGLNLAAGGQFFDVSPNGSHIVFSDRSRNGEPQLWVYDNLWSHVRSASN